MNWDPDEVYRERLLQRQKELQRWSGRDLMLVTFRGMLFAAAIALFFLPVSRWWLCAPVFIFIVVAIIHDHVIRRRDHVRSAVSFYERALERLQDRWIGRGKKGRRFLEGTHPYAGDLDLFGEGSLYELICLAQTQTGEETLAGWLRKSESATTVRKRQAAVAELRDCLDFREDLVLTGSEVRAELHPDILTKWCEAPSLPFSAAARAGAFLLAVAGTLTLAGWGLGLWSGKIFFLTAIVQYLFARHYRKRVHELTEGAEKATDELRVLTRVLARIERQSFEAPLLQERRSTLNTDGLPPSQQIARLGRLMSMLEQQHNNFFAPLAALWLWRTQIAFALESWRRHCGAQVRRWMEVVGEIEALCSLGCFAFEHPEDPFPEIIESEPCFEAKGLGHPLIPVSRCVRNDLSIGPQQRLLILSGSNMSGKSTLLRAVGINTVLALAGGTVRAHQLRLTPLSTGASIRIIDSLQEGTSRFYAEIKRLRQLKDLAAHPPALLFLLDEILHGTNSVDRAVGAEAVLRSFLHNGAIGMITTHDLALTKIAEKLPPAANVHFEDQFEEGQIAFDYRLREGIVQKSNAVALMRSVGLDL